MMLIKARSREVWQWPRIESIWADMEFALAQLNKGPGIHGHRSFDNRVRHRR